LTVCLWPILLKKSVIRNVLILERRKRFFYTQLREICGWKTLPKVKISISAPNFSAAQTMSNFFNTIDPKRSVVRLSVECGWTQATYSHGDQAVEQGRMFQLRRNILQH